MDAQHRQQLLRDLDMHLRLGRHIFPLSPKSKKPLPSSHGLRDRYTRQQLERYIKSGHNLAWALGPKDFVIDIDTDPRHPRAVESFRGVCQIAGIAPGEIGSQTPVVFSGGEGPAKHYYMRLPENVKVRTKLTGYPDLHFKRHGGYVVLPGSQHPSGRYYEWDEFSPYNARPMLMPSKLLELIEIKPNDRKTTDTTMVPDVTVAELDFYLRQLNPRDFRSRQEWLELAFMVHSTLGEDGFEPFMAWSRADDLYRDCEEENERMWASIKDDKSHNLSFGSLVQLVLDKGGKSYRVSAKEEFDDGFDPTRDALDEFIDKLAKMPPNQNDYEIKKLVHEAHQFGAVLWENKLRREVAVCLGIKDSIIEKFYKQISREIKKEKKEQKSKKIDYPEAIAKKVLKEKFDDGRLLIHAINQQFYCYTGTHWEALKENEITKLVYEASLELKLQHKANHEASAKVGNAITALIAKTAKPRNDVFDFTGDIKPVINCSNGEIHIDIKNGIYDFRDHLPESYLLHCLSVAYDPKAECPIWDRAIYGIFENCQEPQKIIQHLYEMFGYVIQPNKDIPSWFLWLGGGNNGKSMVFKILKALIGEHAILPRSIQDLADSGKSNHAIASLVGKLVAIDDDANIDKTLPSATLKKLAESQTWEANPKHKDAFNFRSSATPIVLVNGWPLIKDITHGMLRKIFVFPFTRRFRKGVDEDPTLREKIEATELSGILNHALEGLQRLRQRGYFDPPIDCQIAKDEWLRRSNIVLDWMYTTCAVGNGAWTPMKDLYSSYTTWASQNGLYRPGGQTRLENYLLQRGLKLETRENERGFLGIKVKQ